MKFIRSEFALFVLCGIVNAALTFGIYALALLVIPYFAAYSLSYVSGIFISLYLNSRFVFRSRLDFKKILQYPLVYVVQYLLGLVALYVFVELLGVNKLVASLLTMGLTVPVTFFLSRFILKGRSAKVAESV